MKHLDDIPSRELVPGISGKYTHGLNTTFGYISIKAGSELPAHHHIQEQITYILEGELDMVIGGEPLILKAGSVHVIPSNTPHSATARVDCKVIDVFSPTRDDYR